MSDGVGNGNAHRMDRRSMYIDEIPDDLICPICSDVFDKPIQCSNGHVFCRKCLDDWANKWRGDNADDYGGYPNASDAPCPNCRIAIGRPIPILLVDGVLNAFAVNCKHACFSASSCNDAQDYSRIRSSGLKRKQRGFCSWTGKKKDLERHLRDECEFCCDTCSDCGEAIIRHKNDSDVDHGCLPYLSWQAVKLPAHVDFHSSIVKVLSQVNPGPTDISLNTIILIEDLLAEVLMRLLMQREPITTEAVKQIFVGELAKLAIAECTKVYLSYVVNNAGSADVAPVEV